MDVARSASRLVRAWSGPGKLLALPQIYHFTDVANLPKILAAGELRCHRIARTVDDVGDSSIKSRRGLINVTCGPRGTVWDYVPFDYAARSPMLIPRARASPASIGASARAYAVSVLTFSVGASCSSTMRLAAAIAASIEAP